jgi:hypothetical protein
VSNGTADVGRRIAMLRHRLGLSQVAFARPFAVDGRSSSSGIDVSVGFRAARKSSPGPIARPVQGGSLGGGAGARRHENFTPTREEDRDESA